MRELILDTETTGLDPESGHRLVEIAAVEVEHLIPTGRTWHQYINPERDMPEDAFRIHGLSGDFLGDQPVFLDVVDSFLDFIGDGKLVIHNAPFDMRFLNAELKLVGRPMLALERAVDTLAMAQRKFPGQGNSLDALCRRLAVDATRRVRHGALLDCELLAEVYLHLCGGRQTGLDLATPKARARATAAVRKARPPRHFPVDAAELAAHEAFVDRIENPIWRR